MSQLLAEAKLIAFAGRRYLWGTTFSRALWIVSKLGRAVPEGERVAPEEPSGVEREWTAKGKYRNQIEMDRVPKTEALALPGLGKTRPGGSAPEARAEEDRELVRRAQKDDKQAFEELVRRHQNRVFAVAGGILRSREDVEDIAQQVFLKAYFSIKRFDQRAAFSTWLYKITVNECWDLLRKRKVRPLVVEAELSEEQAQVYQSSSEQADGRPDTSELLAAREEVEELISCLEERDRSMLVLKEVQGFSVEEIAEIMGINANTVKVRLFRARRKITARQRRRNAERRAE